MPEIYDAALRYKAGLARREDAIMRNMAGHWITAMRGLEDEIDGLAATMAKRRAAGLEVTPGYLYRTERYQQLLGQAYGQFNKYETFATDLIAQNQDVFARLGRTQAQELLSILEPGIAGTMNRLAAEATETIAGFVASGSPLRTLLQDAWPAAIEQTTSALVKGVALGYNARKIARMMREGMNVGLNRSMVIARTETLRAYRTNAMAQWKESATIIGFQRVATHDRRTCPACLFSDGAFIPKEDAFAEHPQGRCVAIPVTRRSGTTKWEYGPEWFERQSEATQVSILGRGRLEAWKAGKFDLRDIPQRVDNPIWGPNMRARPLRELLQDAAGGSQRQLWSRTIEPEIIVEYFEDGFPIDLQRLEMVRGLGGSTGAQLVRDPLNGKLYVMKRGADAGHLLEEVAADKAYQAMGVKVPALHLYDTANGPVKLSEFIENGTLLSDLQRTNKKAFNRAVKELQKDFAKDALLGNWDVAGTGFDNIIVDASNQVWRIDNGGALRYRAMGQLKTVWNQHIDEFWTMRNPRVNSYAATIFGDMPYKEVIKQMKALEKYRSEVLDTIPIDLRRVLRGRFDSALDVVKVHGIMAKDKWNEDYLELFEKHMIGWRKEGIIDKLPKKMTAKGYIVYDENGKMFDALRATNYGGPSILDDVQGYINRNGGEHGMISFYASQQAGHSWNKAPKAAKYLMVKQKGGTFSDFYWDGGLDSAKQAFDDTIAKFGERQMQETWAAWHSFNYNFMQTVEFPGNNISKGVVRLIRTESDFVINKHNMAKGDKKIMERGALESTSIFKPYSLYGHNITRQVVPHHRIFGNYMLAGQPGVNSGMFAGDNENEFIAMMEGVIAHFSGK